VFLKVNWFTVFSKANWFTVFSKANWFTVFALRKTNTASVSEIGTKSKKT